MRDKRLFAVSQRWAAINSAVWNYAAMMEIAERERVILAHVAPAVVDVVDFSRDIRIAFKIAANAAKFPLSGLVRSLGFGCWLD